MGVSQGFDFEGPAAGLGTLPGLAQLAIEEWVDVTLGDAADIESGATPSTLVPDFWDGDVAWCTPTDITRTQGKYLSRTKRCITESGLASCTARLLPSGTLLLCSRATIGEVRIAAIDICTNQGFKSLVARPGVSNEFLYYLVLTLKPRMLERAIGSTFLEISKNSLASISIHIPQESEQRAIAEALSDVDDLVEAMAALIAKKQDIKQGTMQQLFTGKARLPGFSCEWKTKRLGDTWTFLPTANNPRAEFDERGDAEYIHYGDVHACAQPLLDCSRGTLPRIQKIRIGNAAELLDGDLVMVDASEDLIGVGKSIEVQGAADRIVVAGLHTTVCRGTSDHWADGFKAYLQFIPAFKSALTRVATGISVYAVSKRQLADVELPLPSRTEQEAIVSILSDMDAEITSLEHRLDKVREIKQGMMQQLLTGRVRLVEPETLAERTAAA